MSDEGRKPGWYKTMAGGMRWYNGVEWTTKIQRPESPYGLVFGGLMVACLGFILFVAASGEEGGELLVIAGAIASAIGTTIASVGTIAAGVRFGMRHHEYERQLRGIEER